MGGFTVIYQLFIYFFPGVAYDLLSGDIMWTLYGFMKNLPEKNTTVDSFMDYSIAFYHRELLRLLELMKVCYYYLLHQHLCTVL